MPANTIYTPRKYEVYMLSSWPVYTLNWILHKLQDTSGRKDKAHSMTDKIMWVDFSCFPKPWRELWKMGHIWFVRWTMRDPRGKEKPFTLATFSFLFSYSCQKMALLFAQNSLLILVYKATSIPLSKTWLHASLPKEPYPDDRSDKYIFCCFSDNGIPQTPFF